MSQNDSTEFEDETSAVITYEDDEDVRAAELRTPESNTAKATFHAAMAGETRLHERVAAIVREHNAAARGRDGMTEIPEEIIDLPAMPTVQRDADDRPYIEDLNSVIRYYLDTSEVQMTGDFLESAQAVDSNERTNTFETIYNTA